MDDEDLTVATPEEQQSYYQDVLIEAARLLGARSVLDLELDAGTYDVCCQDLAYGMNTADVARRLVDDEVIR